MVVTPLGPFPNGELDDEFVMPKRRYFIPLKDGEFFSFQRVLLTKVQGNKTAWSNVHLVIIG